MDERDTLARIRRYISESFLYADPDRVLGEDEPLLERGILDSMGVLELVGFLETEFGITVRDHEITEHHMGSIGAIGRYVASKRAHIGAG